MFRDAFAEKTVWLSGITGFKGAWLTEWLLNLGAKVHGFALPPSTDPALFAQLGLAKRAKVELNDIRDCKAVTNSILAASPDYVFHLAAQPLVRRSYGIRLKHTKQTFSEPCMYWIRYGSSKSCAAIIVTTDKCYENREENYAYREEDPVGGYDPYSSSKAAAEIVTSAYRRSFFSNGATSIASARAGNAIVHRLPLPPPDLLRPCKRGRCALLQPRSAARAVQPGVTPDKTLMIARRLTCEMPLRASLTKWSSIARVLSKSATTPSISGAITATSRASRPCIFRASFPTAITSPLTLLTATTDGWSTMTPRPRTAMMVLADPMSIAIESETRLRKAASPRNDPVFLLRNDMFT